jgi:transglutaminase-like putative cysteine protease
MSSQLKLSAYAALATLATTLSLQSVFQSNAWVIPVMGAVVIVSGTCALVRASPLPSAFEPISAAIAVLIWLTILDARSVSHVGVIPGRLAFRQLGQVARNGFTEIHQLPTPAPAHKGLVLLTVVGVAAIALVVDLMTVTLRRAALSGLPLLALFTVSAATGHDGVGVVPFIAAAIGYLWLLYADNREKVARWGSAVGTGSRARPASAWSTDASAAPAPASLGRQVGAVAISIGVIVPVFIPGLHTGINKHGSGGTDGTGGGSVQTFNPIVNVAAELSSSAVTPVMSYTSTSAQPGYLRLTSLDMFNGSSFTAASLTAPSTATASETLPVTPPTGPLVSSSVTVAPKIDFHWLPVPTTALGVSVSNAWRYDPGTSTIFSATATVAGLKYSARSIVNQPTAAQLAVAGRPEESVAADLTLPADIPTAVKALTRTITANAKSRYAAALAIQRYFTTGSRFTYSTNIKPDTSKNPLANFLLHTRRGFCQQYATAMAVMARLYGIPSRVAVGFTRGKQQPDGSWLVTTHDAHAWPELWFQGFGWLPFEPTPRADGQAVTPNYASPTAKGGPGHKGSKQEPAVPKNSSSPGPAPTHGLGADARNGGSSGGNSRGGGVSSDIELALALIVGLGLVVPGAIRAITRQRRWRRLGDPARGPAAAWAEMRDTAIDIGAPWDDSRTPRQIAVTLLHALEATTNTRDSMTRLARCEEESRYAPAPTTSSADLRRDVLVVRSAAGANRSAGRRAVAMILPRSTLLVARAAMSRAGEALDRARGWVRFARS